jgi:hypothetical protein
MEEIEVKHELVYKQATRPSQGIFRVEAECSCGGWKGTSNSRYNFSYARGSLKDGFQAHELGITPGELRKHRHQRKAS